MLSVSFRTYFLLQKCSLPVEISWGQSHGLGVLRELKCVADRVFFTCLDQASSCSFKVCARVTSLLFCSFLAGSVQIEVGQLVCAEHRNRLPAHDAHIEKACNLICRRKINLLGARVRAPNGACSAQSDEERPKTPQDTPRPPKMPPRPPKTTQRPPDDPSKSPQTTPNNPKPTPRWSLRTFRCPPLCSFSSSHFSLLFSSLCSSRSSLPFSSLLFSSPLPARSSSLTSSLLALFPKAGGAFLLGPLGEVQVAPGGVLGWSWAARGRLGVILEGMLWYDLSPKHGPPNLSKQSTG